MCILSFGYARKRFAGGIDPFRIEEHDGNRACFVLWVSGENVGLNETCFAPDPSRRTLVSMLV
jgi:hypothetical protein